MIKSKIIRLLLITSIIIPTFSNIQSVKAVEVTHTNTIMNDIVQNSYNFLGNSYVYGSNGPSCFDCSGFVQYIFNSYGYNLSRSTYDQVNQGEYVDKSDLQPGDLVFFSSYNEYSPTHVGIYVGNNNFIHASSGKGCVTISSLSNPYYSDNYWTARRIH
ncbi:MAG TPA: NlpC/P60 family protein [Clostridium sp.]|nr:NlpC/P60 family protein [Clostridium sp.]